MPRDPLEAVEPTLENAERLGVFDNLPGKGKPLRLDPSPHAVFNNLLKEAGYKPEWAELLAAAAALQEQAGALLDTRAAAFEGLEAELRSEVARLAEQERATWPACLFRRTQPSPVELLSRRGAELDDDWDAAARRYAALLHQANRNLRRHNEIVPLPDRQKALVPVPERLEEFVTRCPRLRIDPDGTLHRRRGELPVEILTDSDSAPERGLKLPRTQQQLQASQRLHQMGRKPPPVG